MMAVRPSRTSSPVRFSSFSRISFCSRAYRLTIVVSAERKPSSWVPPSAVLIVFAKVCTDSEKAPVHCIATSAAIPVGLLAELDHRLVDRVLGGVEVAHEVGDAAVVAGS